MHLGAKTALKIIRKLEEFFFLKHYEATSGNHAGLADINAKEDTLVLHKKAMDLFSSPGTQALFPFIMASTAPLATVLESFFIKLGTSSIASCMPLAE